MAEASFTLKAIDATKAAFASVQNSLGKLEQSTKSIAKITKLAFGGEAVLGALNMMKQKLDAVSSSGEDIGFSDAQIGASIRMEETINGVLNALTKIPLVLAQAGFSMGNLVTNVSPNDIQERIVAFRSAKSKKEIESTVKSMEEIQNQFKQLGMSSSDLANSIHEAAVSTLMQSQAEFALGKHIDKAYQLQKEGLKGLYEEEVLRKKINEEQFSADAALTEARGKRMNLENELNSLGKAKTLIDKDAMRLLEADRKVQEKFLNDSGLKGEGAAKLKTAAENELSIILDKIIKQRIQMREVGMEAGRMIASSFEDAIFAGEKLSDTLRKLGQDLLRLAFRQTIVNPLGEGAGNFINKLLGRAGGGPVSANTPYMVGEKGPELFVPSSSGSIVPNGAMSSGSGSGSSVNVTYNIASGVSRAELVPILESERKRLKAEIPDMVRRGGAYRTAFA